MNEEIKKMLDEEIKEEFLNLSSYESGSKEKSAAINNLMTLYNLRIEEAKIDLSFIENHENRERDEQLKKEQIKDRYFRLGLEAAGIILPLVFYAVWMRRGFRFEETGTYTSTTFRGLFSRFRPSK